MQLMRYHDPELTAWSPFNRLATLREEMNRLLDGSLAGFTGHVGIFGGWSPTMDVFQDKENVYVKVELPGMKKEAIEITFQDGMLTVSGERKASEQVREGQHFRNERFFGKFHRSISMPTKVEADKIQARYHEGILTIELPKAAEAKAKSIDIKAE